MILPTMHNVNVWDKNCMISINAIKQMTKFNIIHDLKILFIVSTKETTNIIKGIYDKSQANIIPSGENEKASLLSSRIT